MIWLKLIFVQIVEENYRREELSKDFYALNMGKKIFVKIPRYSCKNCGKWHRFIPDYIVPYKHYRKDILNKCKNDTDELEYEDYPADITKYRWKKYSEGYFGKTK